MKKRLDSELEQYNQQGQQAMNQPEVPVMNQPEVPVMNQPVITEQPQIMQ